MWLIQTVLRTRGVHYEVFDELYGPFCMHHPYYLMYCRLSALGNAVVNYATGTTSCETVVPVSILEPTLKLGISPEGSRWRSWW